MRDLLAAFGFSAQVYMFEREVALPDEEPPETWRKLRVGAPQAMITLRRPA